MPGPDDLRAAGDRIEALLHELERSLDPQAWGEVQHLVGLVSDLYGAGLARILELAADDPALRERLADDDLVASLLVVHDLHPLDLQTRVHQALDGVRRDLGSVGGALELLAVEADEGVVRLRMGGADSGCASSPAAVAREVRRAIEAHAPEITRVEIDRPATPVSQATPVALGRKPAAPRPAASAP